MFQRRVSILVGLLSLMAILVVGAVSAQQTNNPRGISEEVYLQLQESIDEVGSASVIVELNIPERYRAESQISADSEVQAQRQAIGTAQEQLLDELGGYNVRVYYQYTIFPYLAMHVDGPALDTLIGSSNVLRVTQDSLSEPLLASSTRVIGAPNVWDRGFDGRGQTVIILDTGIDAEHPFLGGRVTAEACFSNQDGSGSDQSLCPNGAGFQSGQGAADAETASCLYGTENICSHGTHVAGIAGGLDTSSSGVAPAANIIAIQVFTRVDDTGVPDSQRRCKNSGRLVCPLSYTADQLAALEFIVMEFMDDYQIASINMSLGGGEYDEPCDSESFLTNAINNFRVMGIATVIASGNNNYRDAISSPACISNAVTVSATEDNDDIMEECLLIWFYCGGANMHEMVDLLAPGTNIRSSVPGGGFDEYDGTSMAAPHVAGTWALMKAISPGASVDDIERILEGSGVLVTDERDGGIYTKPRIQLDSAIVDGFDILNLTTDSPGYAGPHENPTKVIVRITKPAPAIDIDPDKFAVVVGGKPAKLVTVYEGSDIYAIEFLPPQQDANGLYDVILSAITDKALLAEKQSQALNYTDTNNIDASLVIDRSGSMGASQYMEPAKSAAKFFVNLMKDNDRLAAVAFNHQVSVPFAMRSLDGASRNAAVEAINTISSFGNTSIGGGLKEGQEQLETGGDPLHPWAIVLLSDGFENTSPFVANVLPDIVASKTTVHTIALGSTADQDLLLEIAQQTGGTYNLAPTAAQLQGVYNSIAVTVANQQTLLAVSDVIVASASSIKRVIVDSTVSEATFAITWSNPNAKLDLVLGDPNGQIINPASVGTSPDITYSEGATYAYYRIKTPTLVPGVWTIGIEGGLIPTRASAAQAAGEPYEVLVTGAVVGAAATLNLYLDQPKYNVGEDIRVTATLSDDRPIVGADVVALSGPVVLAGPPARMAETGTDSWPVIKLYDDGNHSDGRANDGVYANVIVAGEDPGIYEFQVFTDGLTNNNQPFSRLVRGSVNVGLTRDSFTPTEQELGYSTYLPFVR